MMKTTSSHNEVGLRPETATATYQNFEDCFTFVGKQFPVKVFQVGKSFRNEIATRHNLIRGREFTQLELQIMLPPEMKSFNILKKLPIDMDQEIQWFDNKDTSEILTWKKILETFKLSQSYFEMLYLTYQIFYQLDLNPNNIRLRQHLSNAKAFYALDAWDIEVNLKDLGWTEIAGVHDRGDYDLNKVLNNKWKKKGIPHILEVAIGIDRLLYCILDNLFEEKDISEGKSMLKIPYFLAPVQVSVLPLVKNKEELVTIGKQIYDNLKPYFVCEYNDSGGIGKRYLKNAINGIPYSITIDYDSIEQNDVTVRDRNTEEQERVNITQLVPYLHQRLRLP